MSGKRKTGITDEKMRKIAAGGTAAGVLLILFLVVILIVHDIDARPCGQFFQFFLNIKHD